MWAWVVAAPLGFMLLLLGLAYIEDTVVLPLDRAVKISSMLEREPADEVEGLVAQMLAPVAPRRRPA